MIGKVLLTIVLVLLAVAGMFAGAGSVGGSVFSEFVNATGPVSAEPSSVTDVLRMVFYGAVDIGRKFVAFILDMISAESPMQTLINGAILSIVFLVLGYLSVAIAKFIRFLLYAAAVFTMGITIMQVLGMIR